MAFELHRHGFSESAAAASDIAPRTAVKISGEDEVVLAASNNDRIVGVVDATALRAENVTVYNEGNIVKAIAAASLGAGGEVGVASVGVSSQVQGGSTLATVTLLGPVSGASGVARWAVGVARSAAAAGEVFSLEVKPRALPDNAGA